MAKIHPYKNAKNEIYLYVFICPGCGYEHPFSVKQWQTGGNPEWEFNNDLEKPTFSPSLVVFKDDPARRCHLHMRDGKIEFLDDSFHKLSGQTVDIPEYEEYEY